jgi:regulator of sirC expression with transglutaminase-like and TPR domain
MKWDGSLEKLLAGDQTITLDRAALELARLEFPELDPQPWIDLLDFHAEKIEQSMEGDPNAFLREAHHYLFEEQGFRGNESSYYDPHNSCLNEVLRQHTGIPITLAIVYLEIGRRLGAEVHGVPLPGHFVTEFRQGSFSVYLDVFRAGRFMNRQECQQMIREMGGNASEADFEPATRQQIILRMLNNLRGIYVRTRAFTKATAIVDWMLVARPLAAELWKQRGQLDIERGDFAQARRDLEQYLHLSPEAEDRAGVERRIAALNVGPLRLN